MASKTHMNVRLSQKAAGEGGSGSESLGSLKGGGQHLRVELLGPACFGLALPRTPLGWELGLWIQQLLALRGTQGKSQLLLAGLDAGIGLLV